MSKIKFNKLKEDGLPRWFPNVWELMQELKSGKLIVKLPDNQVFSVTGSEPGPTGKIEILNEEFFSRLIREGELAFSESYMDGWWQTEDLIALLDVLMSSNEIFGRSFPGAFLVQYYERMRHWFKSNSKSQAKKNIAYHYDLGNEFYSSWLDETMTYSSAYFETGHESLAEAQNKKYGRICKTLNLESGQQLLEIGCGWGGFAEYAINNYGVHVTGLTISKAQYEFANSRLFNAGLAEKANIKLLDYRDETGSYDALASIEMFEAVGERYWPTYFQGVRNRLKEKARATLQIITVADELFPEYRKNVDFIQKYIFPGGMLPSQKILFDQVSKSGLSKLGCYQFGDSYTKTLKLWHEKFNSVWGDISPLGFDDRFRRMWNFYFASCAAVFNTGVGDVTHLTIARD